MISIIVPIYNVEKYLHRCIDSILEQSYSNFELLLINDGSTDCSGAICDEYASKDSRIHAFHKKNGGCSSARNLGLENAKGEWITFVDSDDWVSTDYLKNLVICSNADFIVGGYVGVPKGDKYMASNEFYDRSKFPDFISCYQTNLLRTPWGSLLRLSIIRENSLSFDEKIRYGEDTVFNYQYLCYCGSVRTINSCNYNYFYEYSNSKYDLSLVEVEYALKKMVETKKRLNERINYNLQENLSIDYYTYINKCSVINMRDKVYLEEYYQLCRTFFPDVNKFEFYNNELYSPIFRGIAELKGEYKNRSYRRAIDLYTALKTILHDTSYVIKFRCKDFYLWSFLIKNDLFAVMNIMMKLYMFIKKEFNR